MNTLRSNPGAIWLAAAYVLFAAAIVSLIAPVWYLPIGLGVLSLASGTVALVIRARRPRARSRKERAGLDD